MDITREKTGEQTATVKMVVSPSDYEQNVNKILKDYQRSANIPGFRKGHVPFGMIKKQYGSAIMIDEINKLVSDKLHNYIHEEKLDILGQPLPNIEKNPNEEWEEGKNFEFYFDLGFAPEFDLKLDDSVEVEFQKITANTEMVDRYIDDMRTRLGKFENVDAAGEKDIILGELEQLDADGKVLENGIKKDARVQVDKISDKKVHGKMVGAKAGDVIIFNPVKAINNIVDVAVMLGISKEEAEKMDSDFNYTVKEISNLQPAELNEDFYNKVFPEAGIKTEEDLKSKIKEELEKSFESTSNALFSGKAQQAIMEKTAISLPDDFMKRWLKETNEQLSDEDINRDYDKYAEGMKWQLIENKIIKDADIKVEDQEIRDQVKDYYLQGWRSMPLTEDLAKRLEEIANSFIQEKPNEIRQIIDTLYSQRVAEYIKSKVKLNESSVTYDEFAKLDAQNNK